MANTTSMVTAVRMRVLTKGEGSDVESPSFLAGNVLDGQIKDIVEPKLKLIPKEMDLGAQQKARLYGSCRYENLEFTASALGVAIVHFQRLYTSYIGFEFYKTITGKRPGGVVARTIHTLQGYLVDVSQERLDADGDNAAPFMVDVDYQKVEALVPTGSQTIGTATKETILELEPELYKTYVDGVNVTGELATALGYLA